MSHGKIHVQFVHEAHAYTRSPSPWIMTNCKTAYERMISYICGGGMRTFGRTVRQEEREIRQRRFLRFAAVFALVWLWFLIF